MNTSYPSKLLLQFNELNSRTKYISLAVLFIIGVICFIGLSDSESVKLEKQLIKSVKKDIKEYNLALDIARKSNQSPANKNDIKIELSSIISYNIDNTTSIITPYIGTVSIRRIIYTKPASDSSNAEWSIFQDKPIELTYSYQNNKWVSRTSANILMNP